MILKENNFAYIDGANLHKGVAGLGWRLNYKRFRVWLSEKYGVRAAYLFMGLIRAHLELTQKEKAPGGDGTPQGSFS
ncbi:hypothetical protein HYV91_02015 [Candidatus Wolfebacteria bacterium]|nr:hypothetical protein [Candidatus Wolfebacteria bacterium]